MKIFKERFQPCCGLYLYGAMLWITFLNPIMILIGIGLTILDIFQLWDEWQKERIENLFDYYYRLGLWISYGFHTSTALAIDYVFYKCTRTKNTRQLRSCQIVTGISVTYALLIYYIHTFKFGVHLPTLAIYNGYLLFKYYILIVTHYYIKEIKEEMESASAYRNLTDKEILEFENGIGDLQLCPGIKSLQEKILYMQYEKKTAEISSTDLKMDLSSPLGRGAYGAVYKAQLHSKDGYEMTVAVKTVDPENTDVMYFKALLMEVKVMSHLGKHEHVVNFIGATTAEIKQRKLLIVLEFCSFGSLHSYLRTSRVLFGNLVRNGQLISPSKSNYEESPFTDADQITTVDLIRWAFEIALGMEYLESRKTYHGDLAARNILLTSKKVIKITDFGLARQLYAYSVYVKKQNTPLPWRYLALESLTDMNFSSLSDVWSYGITLWELFTLAEVPWVEYEFCITFVEQLKQGLRLRTPQYATTNLYDLMIRCWNGKPTERPNFTQIADFLCENFKNIAQRPVSDKEKMISNCIHHNVSNGSSNNNNTLIKLTSKETEV